MSQKDTALSTTASDYTQFTLRPKPSAWRRFRHTIRRHPLGAVGGALILALVLIAIFAPVIAPYEPTAQIGKRLQPPSREFILGTDSHTLIDQFSGSSKTKVALTSSPAGPAPAPPRRKGRA